VPARDDHLAQARHNSRFYSAIDRAEFRDWAVTILFYVGLHYVDALLADKGIHPSQHKLRDNAINRVAELRPVYAHYSALKNASFNARYIPPCTYNNAYVSQLETIHLAKVKAQVARYVAI
jgi:hypothetical protein